MSGNQLSKYRRQGGILDSSFLYFTSFSYGSKKKEELPSSNLEKDKV